MKKNDIIIAQITLNLLKKKIWKEIKFEEIIKPGNKTNNSFKSKNDLIKNINRYVDHLLIKETKLIERSTTKDTLFEIIMIRFDILQKYRNSFLRLYDSFKKTPQKSLIFIPSLFESMLLVANLANIKVSGIKGSLIIKGIFIIYIITFLSWINDSSKTLEKTMTALDEYLNQVFKIFHFS